MNVGILVFDKVEELDFVGPLETFSMANDAAGQTVFNVFTVSFGDKKFSAVNKLTVIADYDTNDCPTIDILLIPGGNGRKLIMKDENLLHWVRERHANTQLTLSVCTGAFILAHAGLLSGKNATTNKQCYDEFRQTFPQVRLQENERFVQDAPDGKIITSGGISAGIDMSLYVVSLILGKDVALKTSEIMEYVNQ